MLAIAIRFPAGGRYHATAWGTHANEGVPEWPPSPWRLLRALIATARWKDSPATDADSPRLRRLIEALAAAAPPSYVLPAAAAAHTRHYMPLGDDSTTKIFDTFVQPDHREPLMILWDAALDADDREYLALLLGRMNYLGRAESLAELELLPADAHVPKANCSPFAPGEPLGKDRQTFKLLAPQPPIEYAAWRIARVPAGNARRLTAKERKAQPAEDFFAALHLDTDDWRGAGWSQPPGSRWLEYMRPASPFRLSAPPPRRATRASTEPAFTVARYAIQAPVLESITKALSLGERMHQALCSRSDAASVFSGTANDTPLTGHQHAFYLPECDARGLITHVTVYARMGFSPQAVEALRSLRETWSRRSPGLKLLLLGMGRQGDFPEVPMLAEATEWVSLTPFVPVRHIQRSRTGKPRTDAETGLIRGSSAHDLRRLIVQAGLPAPESIEQPEDVRDALQLPARRLRWANFQRERRHGEGTSIVTHTGHGFRLRFSQAIPGPLAFGYGAHFGLGLFIPAEQT